MTGVHARFIAAALLVVSVAVVLAYEPNWREWLDGLRSSGMAGMAAFAGLYVLSTVLVVPGSALTLAAGFLYGLGGGLVVVVPASLVGASAAFIVARWLARDWAMARFARHPRLGALEQAISGNGGWVVFLLRLSPVVPFSILNYLLGITRLRFRDYAIASALGMLPGTVLYVYLVARQVRCSTRAAFAQAGSRFYSSRVWP